MAQPKAKSPASEAAPPKGGSPGPPATEPAGPPATEPIGRFLDSTTKLLSRAFDRQLAEAGGTRPGWLILLALKQQRWRTQQQVAAAVGIEGPTLTHHLDAMEKAGLIERARDPDDRRAVRVELTKAGEELFVQLAKAALAFDQRLREGVPDDDIETVRRVLARLRDNVVAS
jgi:MarR family transcriptional regulator, transcriptional regulator for hemolysin